MNKLLFIVGFTFIIIGGFLALLRYETKPKVERIYSQSGVRRYIVHLPNIGWVDTTIRIPKEGSFYVEYVNRENFPFSARLNGHEISSRTTGDIAMQALVGITTISTKQASDEVIVTLSNDSNLELKINDPNAGPEDMDIMVTDASAQKEGKSGQ
jgi:hypothetical protein